MGKAGRGQAMVFTSLFCISLLTPYNIVDTYVMTHRSCQIGFFPWPRVQFEQSSLFATLRIVTVFRFSYLDLRSPYIVMDLRDDE